LLRQSAHWWPQFLWPTTAVSDERRRGGYDLFFHHVIKECQMNQEQFKAFWTQLKAPLKAKWEKITDADLLEIEGNLATFTAVLAKRYGTTQNSEVNTWANRRYSHWSGNYTNAYADPVKASSQSRLEYVIQTMVNR